MKNCRFWIIIFFISVFKIPKAFGSDVGTRYNEVRQISSHNSYDIDRIKPGLKEQANKGVRSFEFDLHKGYTFPRTGNYGHSDWGIYHTSDWGSGGEHCQKLSQCLSQLKGWHEQHNNHEVITLWLQLDNWETGGHMPIDLDNNRLEKDLRGLIYTPAQFLQRCPAAKNLQEAAELCGWPTLEELSGKFIVVLHGNNGAALDYLRDVNYYRENEGHQGENLSFVSFAVDNCEQIKNNRDAIFFNINTDESFVAECVFQNNFVSRIWIIDDQGKWDEARALHAHHLATDHVTQEFFEPRAVDSQGAPFEVMNNALPTEVVRPEVFETDRYSETWTFDSSRDDVPNNSNRNSSESRSFSLTEAEINDGWRIKPGSCRFNLVQVIEGSENRDWWNRGCRDENSTGVTCAARTEHHRFGSSGKIRWRIKCRLSKPNQKESNWGYNQNGQYTNS